MNRWGVVLVCSVGAVGCGGDDLRSANLEDPYARSVAEQDFRDQLAQGLTVALADPTARVELLQEMRGQRSVALASLGLEVSRLAPGASTALMASVPEVWLFESEATVLADSEVVVAYAPPGDEDTWSTVRAYDLDGNPVELDPWSAPTRPVVVVESHGHQFQQEAVAAANRALREAGLQRGTASASALSMATRNTVRLDKIRLNDDQEPWVSGDAEIYAITSGVLAQNEAQIRIVDMPYLDEDGRDYWPTQVMLDWTPMAYQAADVLLYEKDDGENYQQLAILLIDAVGAIGNLAGVPQVQALAQITSTIVGAMPDRWFENNDDYVDSYYTVQKGHTYVNHRGAAANATATVVPFDLISN